ncbi:hypothetical protein D3C80_1427340 [compost metagenome]
MKNSFLKNIAAVLFASICLMSCNTRNSEGDGIESDIENPSTSADSATSGGHSGRSQDTSRLKNVDASRLSDGKDSVTGEVTPPNAKDQ